MHLCIVYNLKRKPVDFLSHGIDIKDPNATSKTPGAPQISRCQCYVVSAACPGQSPGCDRSLSLSASTARGKFHPEVHACAELSSLSLCQAQVISTPAQPAQT